MSHGDCCDNCIPVAAVCELNDGGYMYNHILPQACLPLDPSYTHIM